MTIADLGSSNGTFVNGTRLMAEAELADGDRLTMGETELRLAIVPPVPLTAIRSVPDDGDVAPARIVAASVAAAGPAPGELAESWSDTGPRHRTPPPTSAPAVAPLAVVPSGPTAAARPAVVAAPIVPVDPAEATPSPDLLSPIPDLEPAPPAPARGPAAAAPAARPAATVAPHPEFLPPAGFWRRLLAWLLDSLWMTAVAVGASYLAGGPRTVPGGLVLSGVAGLLAVVVPLLGWSRWGTTPGKRLLRLYVCPLEGGVGVGFGKALLRWVGYLLSACLFGLGFLMIGFSAAKRGLHDLVAGTYVGRKP